MFDDHIASAIDDVQRIVNRIDVRTERIEQTLFYGDGEPPILARLATLEERTTAVERMPRRMGIWAVLGTFVGSAVGAVASIFWGNRQ